MGKRSFLIRACVATSLAFPTELEKPYACWYLRRETAPDWLQKLVQILLLMMTTQLRRSRMAGQNLMLLSQPRIL